MTSIIWYLQQIGGLLGVFILLFLLGKVFPEHWRLPRDAVLRGLGVLSVLGSLNAKFNLPFFSSVIAVALLGLILCWKQFKGKPKLGPWDGETYWIASLALVALALHLSPWLTDPRGHSFGQWNGDTLNYIFNIDILRYESLSQFLARHPGFEIGYVVGHAEGKLRLGFLYLASLFARVLNARGVEVMNPTMAFLWSYSAIWIFRIALRIGINARESFLVGLLWAIHPTLLWIDWAHFAPQVLGTVWYLALVWTLLNKDRLPSLRDLGFLLFGLTFGYPELLPMSLVMLGHYLIWSLRNKGLPEGLKTTALWTIVVVAACLNPLTMDYILTGLRHQMTIGAGGGGPQAVNRFWYILSVWTGVMPPPFEAPQALLPWHRVLNAVWMLVFGVCFFRAVMSRGAVLFCLWSGALVATLFVAFRNRLHSDPFASWNYFKILQYALPAVFFTFMLGLAGARVRAQQTALILLIAFAAVGLSTSLNRSLSRHERSIFEVMPGPLTLTTESSFAAPLRFVNVSQLEYSGQNYAAYFYAPGFSNIILHEKDCSADFERVRKTHLNESFDYLCFTDQKVLVSDSRFHTLILK